MKTRHLTFFAAAICLLASCKKNSGTNSNGSSNKLKMYIESGTTGGTTVTDSFNVTYDNNNRVTALTSTQLKFVYAYQSKSLTMDLYNYSQLSIHENFWLNNASVVDSTLQYDNSNDTTTEGYVYNGSVLTAKLTYDYTSSGGASINMREDFTYDNTGNLLKDVQSDGYGNVNQVTAYTYTTHALDLPLNPTYQPLQAKYLPATETLTDGSGNHLATITHTYMFDGSGRLTKETASADNGESGVKTYIYE